MLSKDDFELEPDSGDAEELLQPYSRDGHPQFAESFVCLLDMLGTRAASQTLAKAEKLLAATHSALYRTRDRFDSPGDAAIVRWFTDNAGIAVPCSFREVVWGRERAALLNGSAPIIMAATIQLQLSNLGLFARGGMDLGPFFANAQFLYGPALVCAAVEKRAAVVPRVALSDAYADFARTQATAGVDGFPWDVYQELLAVDEDGRTFVNYLRLAADETDPEEWLRCHLDHARAQRDAASCMHVRLKYEWVLRYHDRFCRQYLDEADPLLKDLMDDPSRTAELSRLG